MYNDVTVTITGNITAAPELRFTPTGKAVTSFQVAHTPRRQDAATNEWIDGETTYLPCEVWECAQNVTESLTKGTRVVVVGRLRTDRYTPTTGEKAGQEQTVFKLLVDEIGPSLRWATAVVTRSRRRTADEQE